jgi:C1A family cysteine protease
MKKSFSLFSISLLMGILIWSVSNTGCTPEEIEQLVETIYQLGWQQTDSVKNVPVTVSDGLPSVASLPQAKDLTGYFPPIGNQGRYGTCVAWATGYNMMTTIKGIKKGWTPSQLADPGYQMSPLDLFTSIPDNEKGSNCGGTNFESALSQIQERGIATLRTAPYGTSLNCSKANEQSAWTADAANNKIKYWRKIEPTANVIKQHIGNNIPVMIGAKLADNFMTWNSDAVLSSNTTYNQVGQHAGHALIISGYDNSKGANGAFKVVNSWGPSWGSKGYIWVDYDFMVNEFVVPSGGGKPIFVAAVDNGSAPPLGSTNTNGVDMAAWVYSDIKTAGVDRKLTFNVFNVGNAKTNLATKPWDLFYVYYNAFDANDLGLIFYDEFRNVDSNGNPIAVGGQAPAGGNNVTLNYDIAAGGNLATAFQAPKLEQPYSMPTGITGKYYLVLIADGEDTLEEKDEENNLFYTTQDPITFTNGVSARQAAPEWGFRNTLPATVENVKKNPYQTAVTAKNRNAYTPEEVITNLKIMKKNGSLARKIQAFRQSQSRLAPNTLKAAR